MTEKEFFDWLRSHQANKKLTQSMVDGANELLAVVGTEKVKDILTDINDWHDVPTMSISEKGLQMINAFEGFRAKPYRDVAGVATIGYGSTYYLDKHGKRTGVTMKDKPISQPQAKALKERVINADFAPAINLLFADEIDKGELTQNMFDALVSFAYNLGIRSLKGSSIYRHIKRGDYKKAGDSFLLWNKARVNGRLQPVQGLKNRRKNERELFLS